VSKELHYLKMLDKDVSERLSKVTKAFNNLSEKDNGALSDDRAIVSLRTQEKEYSDLAYMLNIQDSLLKQIIGFFESEDKIKVPKMFADYVKGQYKKGSYHRNHPGVVIQDMFMELGEEALPEDLDDWIQDHPEDAINAIMTENYEVE